jgi:acyl carrier protein
LDGVIHAAGIAGLESMTSIKEIDKEKCNRVFDSKVSGLFIFEKILKGKILDFCLLFSSLSSILGGIGLAAYSAANIFMDAFARKQSYLTPIHWISINWDLWEFEEQKNRSGGPGANLLALAIEPAEGIDALTCILSQEDIRQVIVSTGELSTRIKQWIQLEFPTGNHSIKERESSVNKDSGLALPGTYNPPTTHLERIITDIWTDYFGIKAIGIYDNFFDLGATSLDLIRLNDRLKKRLKKELAIEKLFTYPTIHSLAGFFTQMESDKLNSVLDDEKMERTEVIKKGKNRLKQRKMSVTE